MSQFIEMFGDVNNTKYKSRQYSISSLFDLQMGKTPDRNNSEYWNNGRNTWISISDMQKKCKYIDTAKETISDSAVNDSGIKKVVKGTIIMSFKLTIGRVMITGIDLYTNEAIMAFVDKGIVDLDQSWLYQLFTQYDWLANASQAAKGKTLNKESIGRSIVHIPPIEEQLKFSEIVEQADKSKFVSFKSQFIEMFEDKGYKLAKLSTLIDKSFPGEWGTDDSDGFGVKVIRTTNITNDDKLDLSNVVTRNIIQTKVDKKKLIKGDILLERSGGTNDNPVGRVAYFDAVGTYVVNNFTQTLRCNSQVHSRYLFYFLYLFYKLNKMKIRSMGNQTTGIQNLNMGDYFNISVIIPPLEKQQEYISIVEQADKSKYFN